MAFKRFTDIRWEEGTCISIGDDAFFVEVGVARVENPVLKKICDACPINVDCGEWGLRHEEYGFWGGMSPADLKATRRERGIPYQRIDYGLSCV